MKIQHSILAVMVAIFWGGNFVAARVALDVLPPFLLLAVRFAAVACLLIPFYIKPRIAWRDIAFLSVILGTVHFALMFGSIYLGLDVSSAVISSQMGVPFSCILGSIIFNDRIGRWRLAGIVTSLIGVIIICGSPRLVEQYPLFIMACGGALAWACGNIYIKHLGQVNILELLGWMSLFSVPQFALLSWLFESGQMKAVIHAQMNIWFALSYTVIFSTIFAYGLWYDLLRRFPMSQVVPYSLLVPVFGLGFAQWFFAEPITWQLLVGGGVTIIGVAIVSIRKPKYVAFK